MTETGRLECIERKIDETLKEVRTLSSYEGPLAKLSADLQENWSATRAAHHRIDATEKRIVRFEEKTDQSIRLLGEKLWSQALRAGGISAGGAGTVVVLWKVIEYLIGN